jgi:micrococcal nuclease
MYTYKAKVLRWVDGDTLLCLIDLGFYTHKEERIRLARIDAPELRGPEKEECKRIQQLLSQRYPQGTFITLESKKRDNYGRFIGELYYHEQSINQWMIDQKLAKEVDY